MLAQLSSLEPISSFLYRARHKDIPILPAHRRDVSLSIRFTWTNTGEDFLQVDNGDDDKTMIFVTEKKLSFTSEAEAVYINGIFSTCPSLYLSLLLVISSWYWCNKHHLQLLFFSIGVHNSHSALWPHTSNSIIVFGPTKRDEHKQCSCYSKMQL